MTTQGIIAVVGAGPALGGAVARRFSREGYAAVLMARTAASTSPTIDAIKAAGGTAGFFEMDATDPGSVNHAFQRCRDEFGAPDVLVYNAGAFQPAGILEIDSETFVRCWQANCYGGFLCAREVLPAMIGAGRGTVILTGATASLRGSAGFANLAVGKFGLRALAQTMAREFGSRSVHVAHTIIDGQIDTPRLREMEPERDQETLLAPDAIAESYWHLHCQHPTAWSLELDLRPSVEKF